MRAIFSARKVLMTDGEIDRPDELLRRITPVGQDPTAALRTVIQLTLRTDLRRVLAGCPIEQSGLRENLRTIGEHARRHQLHAEQLLILIKDACAALPEGRELLVQPERAGTLNQLISMAVEEYFDSAKPAV
ncbi:MAG TPA: hypothetical protein VGJ12_12560 [Gemmatimonadaceae bacterium]